MIRKITNKVEIPKPEYPQFNQFRCYRKDSLKENQAYSTTDLVEDLWTALEYLPRTEVTRIVNMLFWFIKEALRTHSIVFLREFGTFSNTYEGKTREYIYGRLLNKLYMPEYYMLKYPNGGLHKAHINFSATKSFMCTLRPLHRHWFAQLASKNNDQLSMYRAFIETYVHYRKAKVLFEQKPFNRQLDFLGYTDEFFNYRPTTQAEGGKFIPNYEIIERAKPSDKYKNRKGAPPIYPTKKE